MYYFRGIKYKPALIATAALVSILLGYLSVSLGTVFGLLLLGALCLIGYCLLAVRKPYVAMLFFVFLLPIVPTVIGVQSPIGLITVQRALLLVLVIVYLSGFALGISRFTRTPLDRWILVVIAVRFLALTYSPGGLEAVATFVGELTEIYVFYYIVIAWIDDGRKILLVFRLLAVGTFVTGMYGIAESVRGYNPLDTWFTGVPGWWNAPIGYRSLEYHMLYRTHSTFSHPIAFGWYLCLALAPIWVLRGQVGRIGKVVLTGLFVLIVVIILLSLARVTWVGALISIVVLLILAFARRFSTFLGEVFAAAVVLTIVFVVVLPIFSPELSGGFGEIVGTSLDTTRRSSLWGRIQLLRAGLQLSLENPFGYGLYLTSRYQVLKSEMFGSLAEQLFGFESQYVALLIETGWLGLLTTLGLYLAALYNAWYSYRNADNQLHRRLALALTASLASNLVILAGTSYLGPMQGWVWVLIAFSSQMRLIVDRSKAKPDHESRELRVFVDG